MYNRFLAGETIAEMSKKFGVTKGDIKDSLKRYNVFAEINTLDLDDKQREVLVEETKFNMTNVERVYVSKQGREFLGIDFDENGQVIRKLPPQEYKNRLKKIVEDVIDGTINSRTLNTEDEKKAYIDQVTKEFDTTIALNRRHNDEYVREIEATDMVPQDDVDKKTTVRRKAVLENRLFSSDLSCITGIT